MWRIKKDFGTLNSGQKGSSHAFPDTEQSLRVYDAGLYCHHSFNMESWPYWGETAIPKKYVLDNWGKIFTFLDYLESGQNVIIVQKPFDSNYTENHLEPKDTYSIHSTINVP